MEYFPLGLAEGSAFCNRVDERNKLKTNIDLNRSTIVMSPRRYGKSSLVLYVLQEINLPYKRVDLFVTIDESTVSREIIDGVNSLINQVINKPEQLITSAKDILKNINTKWSIGTDGARIELSRKARNNDALAIRDALTILDTILERKNKKAVFFIDEFQEIGVVANAKGIEGAIRSVAEKTQNLIFIFSGSNRHVLETMFDDRSRPLYMLCDKILLNRIDKQDYIKFINKIAKKKWGHFLAQQFYDQLFVLTEAHPYYMNLICGRLYSEFKSLPTYKNVSAVWENYLFEEKSKTAIELAKLSLLQKKLIVLIAQGQHERLTSKDTTQKLLSTSGAIIKALKSLVAKDYIYEGDRSTYRLVDPLIKSSIQKFFLRDELM